MSKIRKLIHLARRQGCWRKTAERTMPKSFDTATVELAMTLSTLAYVDENRIASQQEMIDEINAGLDEAGYRS
jgi:hypothetical protein